MTALDLDAGAKSKARPDEFCLVKDRGSDEAEHIMYKAIEQLIHERIRAPFVAIHNFNMNRARCFLQDLFPRVKAAALDDGFCCAFREYDFLLIGPKVGLIVIEVKSSHFTQKKDFLKGHKVLPDDYFKGLQQLRSFESVVSLLQKCSDVDIGIGKNVQKVLFTPNLQRSRFYEWYNDLNTASERVVDKHLKTANVRWFAEDMGSPRTIYSRLRQLLQSSSVLQNSESSYEIYCPMIVGIASFTIFPCHCIGLAADKLSEGAA